MILNPVDIQYRMLVEKILNKGIERSDRTGVGTKSIFGHTMRFDLNDGFPILTTKRVLFGKIKDELFWFLSGECDNLNTLPERSHPLWKYWADKDGNLGRIYGVQWRKWNNMYLTPSDKINHYLESIKAGRQVGKQVTYGNMTSGGMNSIIRVEIDQIKILIHNLKNDPFSRRHIISAWNVGELGQMALVPCHYSFQCYVSNSNQLSMLVNIRSNDICLGNPFNVPSYALLIHILAEICGFDVGELIINIGDAHIYNNHIDIVKEQMLRTPLDLPKLKINKKIENIDDLKSEDFELVGYNPHPFVKYPVAV